VACKVEKIGALVLKLIRDTIEHGPGHQLSPVPLLPRWTFGIRFFNGIDAIHLNYTLCFGAPPMSSTQKLDALRLLGGSVQTIFSFGDIFASDRTTKVLGAVRKVEWEKVPKYEVRLEEELQVSLEFQEYNKNGPVGLANPRVVTVSFGRGGLTDADDRHWRVKAVVHNNVEALKAVTERLGY
jgi:hypothetical protein